MRGEFFLQYTSMEVRAVAAEFAERVLGSTAIGGVCPDYFVDIINEVCSLTLFPDSRAVQEVQSFGVITGR